MACILCGGARAPWLEMPIDAKTRAPTPYGRVERCDACGLGVVAPLPSAAEVPGFYRLGPDYTHGGRHFAKGEAPSLFDRIRVHIAWRFDRGDAATVERLLSRVGGREGLRVCDIGSGDGQLVKAFAERGADATGVDPDPEAVARGRAAGRDIRHGAGETLPDTLERGEFDLVVMSHSLEHCLDPVATVRSVYGLLKQGGTFVCETPNAACAHFKRFNIVSEMFDAPRHLYYFSPQNLAMTLEKGGMKVTDRYFCGYARLFSNDWRATENRIRDALAASGRISSALPPAHSRAQSWRLLAETFWADKEAKYDSIGVVGVKAT